jgi:hypothetical protein
MIMKKMKLKKENNTKYDNEKNRREKLEKRRIFY